MSVKLNPMPGLWHEVKGGKIYRSSVGACRSPTDLPCVREFTEREQQPRTSGVRTDSPGGEHARSEGSACSWGVSALRHRDLDARKTGWRASTEEANASATGKAGSARGTAAGEPSGLDQKRDGSLGPHTSVRRQKRMSFVMRGAQGHSAKCATNSKESPCCGRRGSPLVAL